MVAGDRLKLDMNKDHITLSISLGYHSYKGLYMSMGVGEDFCQNGEDFLDTKTEF
jgi:hypothetical protein